LFQYDISSNFIDLYIAIIYNKDTVSKGDKVRNLRRLIAYIITLSIILIAYNNCGESFQSTGDFTNSSNSQTSTISPGEPPTPTIQYAFSLNNLNLEKNSYYGKVEDLAIAFEDSNSLKTPAIFLSGFICSQTGDEQIKITVLRYFESNSSPELLTESRKHLLKSATITTTTPNSEETSSVCGNGNFKINHNFEDLKINVESLNNDEKYIHNDYFLVEISDDNLPESSVDSPMLNQLPGKLTFVDPYVIPTVVPPEPVIGTWGEWTEKIVGTCDNGKQSYELTRTCNDNLECKTAEDKLAKTESKTEERNCTVTPPTNVYNPPDVVKGIKTPRRKTGWSDSYSVDGQCYCDSSNFDHGLHKISTGTPKGKKKVTEICGDLKKKFGEGRKNGRVYFNDIQCGHGPANEAADEKVCPGIPNGNRYSGARCKEKGSTWNLDKLYN